MHVSVYVVVADGETLAVPEIPVPPTPLFTVQLVCRFASPDQESGADSPGWMVVLVPNEIVPCLHTVKETLLIPA